MSTPVTGLEAILNISVNLGEIAGIGAGLRLLVGSAVIGAQKYGRAKQWFVWALVTMVLALCSPGLITMLASGNMFLAIVAGWAIAIPLVIWGWHCWFLPYTIARVDGKPHPVLFLFCCLSVVLGPAWLFCIIIASRNKSPQAIAAANPVPPVLVRLVERFTKRQTKMLGCGQVHGIEEDPPTDLSNR